MGRGVEVQLTYTLACKSICNTSDPLAQKAYKDETNDWRSKIRNNWFLKFKRLEVGCPGSENESTWAIHDAHQVRDFDEGKCTYFTLDLLKLCLSRMKEHLQIL